MEQEIQEGIAEETAEVNTEAVVSFAELLKRRLSRGAENEQE